MMRHGIVPGVRWPPVPELGSHPEEDPTTSRETGGSGAPRQTPFQLLRLAQRGDVAALGALCAAHDSVLERWVTTGLPHEPSARADVRALVTESVKAVVVDAEPSHEATLWLELRQAIVERARQKLGSGDRGGGVPPGGQADNLAAYETALTHLRAEEREAIVTRIEMRCSYEQVAELLGKPSTGAARMAVCRALLRLAQEMAR